MDKRREIRVGFVRELAAWCVLRADEVVRDFPDIFAAENHAEWMRADCYGCHIHDEKCFSHRCLWEHENRGWSA